LLRLLSMLWTMVRFHGFRLTLVGDDVKTEFGLLTRVSASLPNHRIQAVVVRESPLQRRLGRVSVRAQTAGGSAGGGELDGETGQQSAESASLKDRAWLAPILRRDELAKFLAPLLSSFDLTAVDWQPVHPGAVRRALKSWLRVLAVPIVLLTPFLTWWTPLVALPLGVWAWFGARGEIAGLRWALTDGHALLRSGWLWRRLIIVPIDRVQTVTLHSSPWDRRARMARIGIDTAGGGALGSPFEIPYLADDVAIDLAARLEREVATRPFRW
jgi:putative membrane protein